jgi:hypothetical protein
MSLPPDYSQSLRPSQQAEALRKYTKKDKKKPPPKPSDSNYEGYSYGGYRGYK